MNTFMKGMTTGLAVGATCALVIMPKSKGNKRMMKHQAGRTLKTVGSLIDSFQSILD